MPYERFADLYDIEPDSLAEDDYEDFINDLIIDYGEEDSPFSLDYDNFVERLEGNDNSTHEHFEYDAMRGVYEG